MPCTLWGNLRLSSWPHPWQRKEHYSRQDPMSPTIRCVCAWKIL
jgi:hypothetical protein